MNKQDQDYIMLSLGEKEMIGQQKQRSSIPGKKSYLVGRKKPGSLDRRGEMGLEGL